MSIPVKSSVKYQDKIRRLNAFTNISFFFPIFIPSVFPKVLFWQNTLTTSHNFHFQCLIPGLLWKCHHPDTSVKLDQRVLFGTDLNPMFFPGQPEATIMKVSMVLWTMISFGVQVRKNGCIGKRIFRPINHSSYPTSKFQP